MVGYYIGSTKYGTDLMSCFHFSYLAPYLILITMKDHERMDHEVFVLMMPHENRHHGGSHAPPHIPVHHPTSDLLFFLNDGTPYLNQQTANMSIPSQSKPIPSGYEKKHSYGKNGSCIDVNVMIYLLKIVVLIDFPYSYTSVRIPLFLGLHHCSHGL